MDLTLHKPDDTYFVRSFGPEGITVTNTVYPYSLVLSGEKLVSDWPVRSVDALDESHLEPILALEPEIVVLGTGAEHVFPEPKLLMRFYERGIGLETMTTPAACRTFNVLLSEKRNVVAALIQD
ncbi:MAG: Xcc1710-like domain-containing protein [Xanthomonadales bacterium]|nr:Mth938-like domain-containing protein [Gammaproteobacteria bacterium]MBT8056664.1 Mth938-like domain-containing protein [Gammaproteobacteria bacterium]NNJ79847.1 Xcc1710-like domain-containing protein [Xanthomonadales bacterium]NNL03771.1 Xcc1710-like domain-containing protein [Xanthomonadales bacterium]